MEGSRSIPSNRILPKSSNQNNEIKELNSFHLYWNDFNSVSKTRRLQSNAKINRSLDSSKNRNNYINNTNQKPESVLAHFFNEISRGMQDFFAKGNLHGVRYIVNQSFSLKDRLIWTLLTALSVAICAVNIVDMIHQWGNRPFVIVMDSLLTPVWDIPFPKVVICPAIHVKSSYLNISGETDWLSMFSAALLCPSLSAKSFATKRSLDIAEQYKVKDFILNASLSCSDIVKKCSWQSGNVDHLRYPGEDNCCKKYFDPIFTSEGYCYGFNILPGHAAMSAESDEWLKSYGYGSDGNVSWTLDDGFSDQVSAFNQESRPLRAVAAGEDHGLSLELYLNTSEIQPECENAATGFTLVIGSVMNHAYRSNFIRIPMNMMTTIQVMPSTIRTENELKSVPPERRKCYFQNEVRLEYYSIYTESNCKHDTMIKKTKDKCGCVPHNWPLTNLYDKICATLEDFQCAEHVKEEVYAETMSRFYTDKASSHNSGSKDVSSRCYPSCNDVFYETIVYYSNINDDTSSEKPMWAAEPTKINEVTRVNIHYNDDQFLGVHRHVNYDMTYKIGAVGGVLSLFLGFSVVSIAEFVFYVLLKPAERTIMKIIHGTVD